MRPPKNQRVSRVSGRSAAVASRQTRRPTGAVLADRPSPEGDPNRAPAVADLRFVKAPAAAGRPLEQACSSTIAANFVAVTAGCELTVPLAVTSATHYIRSQTARAQLSTTRPSLHKEIKP